ncbi:MAG TPA: FecR domain-containing protein [Pyrinomonadaceae bacterium]|nr:FecR domain-containing protein [Pyrinomonadaceae bacterium]
MSQQLSPYCHGELREEESRQVAEHLMGCQRCRQEFEEVKLGVKLAEQLPLASAPASLWGEIEAAFLKASGPAEAAEPASARAFAFTWRQAVAACAVLILAIGAIWLLGGRRNVPQIAKRGDETNVANPPTINPVEQPQQLPATARSSTPGKTNDKPVQATAAPPPAPFAAWEVARLEGAPRVGAERIEGSGRLAVGEWLETDATSRAQLNVANIGRVEIEPNSRVRLVGTSQTEHRLALARGQLHATISAPPRLFIVETPSAVAVDLGCSYTLKVDGAGSSILHVTSGWVALELKGRESVVPAGAVCVTRPGKGPGTPYFDDASKRFQAALARLDFQQGGMSALKVVLSEAREYDTLTLWHLLSRVPGMERERVYERMAALIPPPQGVTREGVMKLDKGMLDLWKKGMEWAWFE